MPEKTIQQDLQDRGVSRRDFLKLSGLLAAAMGMTAVPPVEASALSVSNVGRGYQPNEIIAQALATAQRAPVIWLEFQDCAGCSEAITRTVAPSLVNLVLNTLTIEYHETLSAAAGFQVEQAKQDAMKKYAGQY